MNLGGYPAGVTDGSFDQHTDEYCTACGLLVGEDCQCGQEDHENARTDG